MIVYLNLQVEYRRHLFKLCDKGGEVGKVDDIVKMVPNPGDIVQCRGSPFPRDTGASAAIHSFPLLAPLQFDETTKNQILCASVAAAVTEMGLNY